MINIRAAGAADINDISRVLAASWNTAYRGIVDDGYLDSLKNDRWVSFLTSGFNDNSLFSMVAQIGREIIGAAILSKAENENEADLVSFYILPDKIGQGIGHAFYGGIEAELKSRGFVSCILDVLENNKRAIRFYESHGFVNSGREVTAVLGGRGYTCKVFEKALR
jgi:ribosomal protein S18 acetylase RimI-like enzyme